MDLLALLLATVFFAGFTQGVTGFGFGLVTMGILPLVLDVREAVPLVAVMGLVTAGMVLAQWRHHVDRRKIGPMVAGGVVGVPLGVYFLVSVDEKLVVGVLGGLLALYAAGSLVREVKAGAADPETPGVRTGWGYAAGAAGGLIGGAFNIGGPPVILYATARRWAPGAFKGNLSLFFVLMTVFQLVLLVAKGLVTPSVLAMDGVALPALALGVWAGHAASKRLSPVVFRRIVLVLLLVLGVNFLAGSLGAVW